MSDRPRRIPVVLRTLVAEADRQRCAYCLSSVSISGMSLSIDHIQPLSRGGIGAFENLCQCCRPCNEFKSGRVSGPDPLTGIDVPLFHPRQQDWSDHFVWAGGGVLVEGVTPVGRATVIALRMNNATIVAARRRWVAAGWHPPADEPPGLA